MRLNYNDALRHKENALRHKRNALRHKRNTARHEVDYLLLENICEIKGES